MKQCTCYALRAIDCTCKPAKYGELYTSPTAKQEQGEPVAVRQSNGEIYVLGSALVPIGAYLYTTPLQRKPLTDEELCQLASEYLHYQIESYEVSGIYSFARAIEAAHGIKE